MTDFLASIGTIITSVLSWFKSITTYLVGENVVFQIIVAVLIFLQLAFIIFKIVQSIYTSSYHDSNSFWGNIFY